MLQSRKGNMLDLPLIIIVLFAFAFVVLISSVILDEFQDATHDTNINQTYIDRGIDSVIMLDSMFLVVTIMLGIATAIMAFYIKTHPVFFAISFVLLILFTLISVFFTNTFVFIYEHDTFADVAPSFPLIEYIFKDLPLFIAVIGIIIMIALYAKGGSGRSDEL
jgi:hypothetical protein